MLSIQEIFRVGGSGLLFGCRVSWQYGLRMSELQQTPSSFRVFVYELFLRRKVWTLFAFTLPELGCELFGVIGTLSGLVCYTDCMQKEFNIHIIGQLMSREYVALLRIS